MNHQHVGNHERHTAAAGRTQFYECPSTLFLGNPQGDSVCDKSRDERIAFLRRKMPLLDKLFTALADGSQFTKLDIMLALSEMSLFITDPDQVGADGYPLEERMSGKKCRFCC